MLINSIIMTVRLCNTTVMMLVIGLAFWQLPAALAQIGGLESMWARLPSDHRSWDGGLGWQAVLVWYLIALQTVVEPAFYQRVFAARNQGTARTGVLISVGMWMVFDFLTVSSGLAARVLLPDLQDPMAAYPQLASLVLSPWMAALFTVGLFATVMSTLDSYLFIAATTVGHDLSSGAVGTDDERRRTSPPLRRGVRALGDLLPRRAVRHPLPTARRTRRRQSRRRLHGRAGTGQAGLSRALPHA